MQDRLFSRIMMTVKNKIYLIIGRGILKAINNDESKTQKIQIVGLSGETITDIERLQNYGFESFPDADDDHEVLVVYPGGNRDQGIAIVIHNRDRPDDLKVGDVRVWDKHGNSIELSKTGIKLNTGDASSWLPNIIPVDPFTGAVHGGSGAGIVKLTGG